MKPNTKAVLLLVSSWIVAAIVGGVLINWLFMQPSTRVISVWVQPSTVQYGENSPYSLSVVSPSVDHLSWTTGAAFKIVVGREAEKLSHRDWVFFSFHFPSARDSLNPSDYIHSSKVEWATDGVTFVEANGTRLFIPKELFVGK